MFVQNMPLGPKVTTSRVSHDLRRLMSLWSYYNGNFGFVTPYGVIIKLPLNKGRQK